METVNELDYFATRPSFNNQNKGQIVMHPPDIKSMCLEADGHVSVDGWPLFCSRIPALLADHWPIDKFVPCQIIKLFICYCFAKRSRLFLFNLSRTATRDFPIS